MTDITRSFIDPLAGRDDNLSIVPASPNWHGAVTAAADRINEDWVMPETATHPTIAGMGEELATLLCAYGVL